MPAENNTTAILAKTVVTVEAAAGFSCCLIVDALARRGSNAVSAMPSDSLVSPLLLFVPLLPENNSADPSPPLASEDDELPHRRLRFQILFHTDMILKCGWTFSEKNCVGH